MGDSEVIWTSFSVVWFDSMWQHHDFSPPVSIYKEDNVEYTATFDDTSSLKLQKSLKMPNGWLEAIPQKTDNAMTNKKKNKTINSPHKNTT